MTTELMYNKCMKNKIKHWTEEEFLEWQDSLPEISGEGDPVIDRLIAEGRIFKMTPEEIKISDLEKKVRILTRALKQYADPGMWGAEKGGGAFNIFNEFDDLWKDGWQIAEKALERIEEINKEKM